MDQEEFNQTQQKSFPMRIVLLETGNCMYDLWLPAVKEGRFTFDGLEDDISILAEKNEWYAVVNRKGYFLSRDGAPAKKLLLTDQSLAKAVVEGKNYTLYAEADRGQGNVFIPYYIERHSDIIIGRAQDCDICYANTYLSRWHATLRWSGNRWTIIDNDSKNGVFVNGKSVRRCDLSLGDMIYIMGIYIIMGTGFIAMNNADNRILMTSPKIHAIQSGRDVMFAAPQSPQPPQFFDRKPRKKYTLNEDTIEIDMPPPPMTANKIPLALRLGSPAVMGGRAIFTGNYLSALTSLVFPALTQGLTEKDRKEYEAKRTARYTEYLQIKRQEIAKEIAEEVRQLNEIYPTLNQTLAFTTTKTRLWERRKIDDDFLLVRLGSGSRPMVAKLEYQPKKFEMEPDPLMDEMYKVAEAPTMLNNVPIMISLRDDYISGIIGKHQYAMALVRNMIAYLAVTHAFDELKMVLLADKEDLDTFDFAKYLPHFWDNERNVRFIASTGEDTQQIAKYLNGRWLLTQDEAAKDLKTELKKQPAYVVFALSKELFNATEMLKELLSSEEYTGVSLVTAFDGAPKECSKLISLKNGCSYIDLVNPEVEDQPFEMDPSDPGNMQQSMQLIMQTKLRMEAQQYALPNMISFLEMYKAGRVEHLNPIARWAANNPVKSLAAPLGVGTDGKLFYLDLHEKRQGPHGLVAGMTGSGKSEFIITYILSMAVNFSPDEVAFVLIDYKGGGLADAFVDPARDIHLPHVVATITNLDGASINRSLVSIRSELKRRQAVFKKAKSETNEGTMDIYDYQKLYRNKRVKEPMPHLFIISDEFAELKKQQPEFMDELISTARIGRSLGVHLILATQKPGGVVNDQIWSNTKFRACLRVQDKSDSMEMLKRPEAAELKNTGRFYLQVGYNELFALGQSAWCGAGYTPQDEVITEKDESVRFIDSVGQTLLEAKPKKDTSKKAECKQIVAVVQYLSDLAKREGIIPRSLWKEPLPKTLEFDTLKQQVDLAVLSPLEAVVGLVDDLERQEQFPVTVDFLSLRHMWICGTSGSGKSHQIRTILYSLMERTTPEDFSYYVLDLSGGALRPMADTPWCGAYLTENNDADFGRLLEMIQNIVAMRKKLFTEAGVTNYKSYLEVGKLPFILVVMDNYSAIQNFRNGADLYATFGNRLKEAAGYGVCFLLSSNHINEVHSRTRQEIDFRLALQAKDRYEYTDILGVRCTQDETTAPGRGFCLVNGEPLEYQTAIPDAPLGDSERAQALRERLARLAERLPPNLTAQRLPMASQEQTYEEFCASFGSGRIPLGYSVKDMRQIALPLKQTYCVPIWFGNKNGVLPVWSNVLYAAAREHMRLVLVRGSSASVFEKPETVPVLMNYPEEKIILESTEEGLRKLSDILQKETLRRNEVRDAFCERNGILATAKNRAIRAEKEIRAACGNLLILFERFGDIVTLPQSEIADGIRKGVLQTMFERAKGYSMFFFAGFYPEDEGINSPMIKSLVMSKTVMFFGGQLGRQCLFGTLPMEYRRREKQDPNYDRYLLLYRTEFFDMRMPCGPLVTAEEDPDDTAIVT
ncbi:MAG: type VII secretion protein EssC [Oscillospiraceae bacterium]|nr:type VII secretion protein EssC [Oscillospiraceae bacterium]